jgi:hypothetical protein
LLGYSVGDKLFLGNVGIYGFLSLVLLHTWKAII